MTIFAYILSVSAIVVMAVNLLLLISLLSKFSGGGQVKSRIQLLLTLVLFFLIGYIVAPFLMAAGLLHDISAILVFSVFLLGALYVTVTIAVLQKIFLILNLLKPKKTTSED